MYLVCDVDQVYCCSHLPFISLVKLINQAKTLSHVHL